MLSNIAKWLLLNSKAGAIIGLVQVGLLVAVLSAWGVTSLELRSARSANMGMAQSLGRATGQLDQLATDSERRAKEAQDAVQAARADAQRAYARSRTLAQAKPSYPNDLCRSADELIRQEIRQKDPQ